MGLAKNLRTVTTPDGAAVLDLGRGKMFQLNPTGAAILDFLALGYDEERVTVELARRCRVECAVVSSDVQSFIASLRNHGLIE
jgi:Coenzyme PQQ synthesis protein D (PqqD)